MSVLQSRRWRRRLTITTLVVAVGGPLIYLGVHFSTPGNPGNPTGPAVTDYQQPKAVPFTLENQHAVHQVLKNFISTAVVRRNVRRSWDLVSPSLREGVTRTQWNRGDIPVVPYPAANRGLGQWSFVQYSYAKTVGLEVFLFPQPGSGYSAMTADVELVKGPDRRWRVDYWMPKRFHGPPAAAAQAKARPKLRAGGTVNRKHRARSTRAANPAVPSVVEPHPSRLWWIVPIAVVSLLIVLPLAIMVALWYQNRKALREYRRGTERV